MVNEHNHSIRATGAADNGVSITSHNATVHMSTYQRSIQVPGQYWTPVDGEDHGDNKQLW